MPPGSTSGTVVLGFRKYPVLLRSTHHKDAAIIKLLLLNTL